MGNQPCPCTGETLDRFLRPTVMAVLARAREGMHGYLIAQHLHEIPIFGDVPPDPTGLYRVLKVMEEEGYLESEWNVEGSGPAKRVYRLTGSGHACLRRWVKTLESYSANLQQTVKYVKRSATLQTENSDRCSAR